MRFWDLVLWGVLGVFVGLLMKALALGVVVLAVSFGVVNATVLHVLYVAVLVAAFVAWLLSISAIVDWWYTRKLAQGWVPV